MCVYVGEVANPLNNLIMGLKVKPQSEQKIIQQKIFNYLMGEL